MIKNSIFISGMLALALGFTGCNSEEFEGAQTSQAAGETVLFSAKFDSDIKKIAYGDYSAGRTDINWIKDDEVKIYSDKSKAGATQQAIYKALAGGATTSDFEYVSGTLTDGLTWAEEGGYPQTFYAIYPGKTGAATNPIFSDEFSFTIPTVQDLSAHNGMENVLLYAAKTETAKAEYVSLNFRNVPTVLAVEVTGNTRNIKAIEVTGTGAHAAKIAGTYTGSIHANPATGIFTNDFTASNIRNKVSAILPASWKNGTVYITVAPYDLSSLTVKLIDEDNNYVDFSRTDPVIARTLYKLGIGGADLTAWNNGVMRTAQNSVDMGILVKSISSEHAPSSGGIVTHVIGKADKSLAWLVANNASGSDGTVTVLNAGTNPTAAQALEGANALYFATGNLLIATYGFPSIERTSAETNTSTFGLDYLNFGLYGWGDPNGDMSLQENDIYPLKPGGGYFTTEDRPRHISGNVDFDVARAQLKYDWRLPTAVEWAFLIEEIATTGKAGIVGGTNYYPVSTGYADRSHAYVTGPWQGEVDFEHYLITSAITGESIFLPALGYRDGNTIEDKNEGSYFSGTFHAHPNARVLQFRDDLWHLNTGGYRFGRAIRPVWE